MKFEIAMDGISLCSPTPSEHVEETTVALKICEKKRPSSEAGFGLSISGLHKIS